MVKNMPANAGDMGSVPWGTKIPHALWQLSPYHSRRSLCAATKTQCSQKKKKRLEEERGLHPYLVIQVTDSFSPSSKITHSDSSLQDQRHEQIPLSSLKGGATLIFNVFKEDIFKNYTSLRWDEEGGLRGRGHGYARG